MRHQRNVHPLIERFARSLGWRGLHAYEHIIDDAENDEHWGDVIRYYVDESSPPLYFQINEHPYWVAAVYAVNKYRMFTGWYAFRLCKDPARLQAEAERLAPMLHARNFATPQSRRVLRQQFSHMADWNWTRVRNKHAPYFDRTGSRIRHPAQSG